MRVKRPRPSISLGQTEPRRQARGGGPRGGRGGYEFGSGGGSWYEFHQPHNDLFSPPFFGSPFFFLFLFFD